MPKTLLHQRQRPHQQPPSSGELARAGISAPLRKRDTMISEPGDALEQEADRGADAILSGHMLEMPSPAHTVQRKEAQAFPQETAAPGEVQLRGPGQALEPHVRDFMEARIGHSLATIRIHNDAETAQSAQYLDARAYTIGHHIGFARGAYAPSTSEGKRLLAHELVHVMQQERTPHLGPPIQRQKNEGDEGEPQESRMARIKAEKGLRLRSKPSLDDAGVLILPFDTPVQIHRTENGWCYVSALYNPDLERALLAHGYCEERFLEPNPPEPDAHLHYIKPGETLETIINHYYKPPGGFQGLKTIPLYVHALWTVNQHKTSIRLSKKDPNLSSWQQLWLSDEKEQTQAIYQAVQISADQVLWIPSEAYVEQLLAMGQITTGSARGPSAVPISAVANYAHPLYFLNPFIETSEKIGFVGGLLKGYYSAIRDLIMGFPDLVGLLYDILKTPPSSPAFVQACADIVVDLIALWGNKEKLVQKLGEDIAEGWFHADPYERGLYRGEAIGYAIMTILLGAMSGGTIAAAKAGGKFSKLIQTVKTLDKLANPLEYKGLAQSFGHIPKGKAVSGAKKASGWGAPTSKRADDLTTGMGADKALQTAEDLANFSFINDLQRGFLFEDWVAEGLRLDPIARSMKLGGGGRFVVVDCVHENKIISIATGQPRTLVRKFKELIGMGKDPAKWKDMWTDLEKVSNAQGLGLDLADSKERLKNLRLWIPKGQKKALVENLLKDKVFLENKELVELQQAMGNRSFEDIFDTMIEEKEVMARISGGQEPGP